MNESLTSTRSNPAAHSSARTKAASMSPPTSPKKSPKTPEAFGVMILPPPMGEGDVVLTPAMLHKEAKEESKV